METWFSDTWHYWQRTICSDNDLPSFVEAEEIRVRLLASGSLDALSDMGDRVLVCDAVVYRCELFCTRDWRTVLQLRDDLRGLPLSIVTPAEWWAKMEPYARLWL